MCRKVHAAIALLLAATLLSACTRATRSASPSDTGPSIREALDNYAVRHCAFESVVEHGGPGGRSQLHEARRWLADLLRDPHVHVLWSDNDAYNSNGVLEYERRGHPYRVWWTSYHPPGITVRDNLKVHACIFAPKRVLVFDESFGPWHKEASILYQPRLGYSWIGQQLRTRGLLVRNNDIPRIGPFEWRAALEKKSDGEWKVMADKLNG